MVDAADVLPTHAGMVPEAKRAARNWPGAPRARRDGPDNILTGNPVLSCSRRTRGWSHARDLLVASVLVLPAHAG
ncbi:hypothetical protein [Nonomuraea jabiensis]|uniref:hypothetical protein n=1 Tax=Nonomuraea jabiensis TaxID=882448 RepID=UPI00160E5563|nr:hypothetical protein [Nonomuraea jabiensis]